jgi:hypothetical protein
VLKRVLEQDSAQQALARSVLPKRRSVLMRSSVVNRAALTKTGAVLAKKRRSVLMGAVLAKKRRSVLMGAVLAKKTRSWKNGGVPFL